MAGLRFTDMQSRPTEFLDLTSVSLDEFQQLVPLFEDAFQAHMTTWRLDGKPRTARRFTVYKTCSLPIRLWKQGVRDLVMELCCVLRNFRVRLTPVAAADLIEINPSELVDNCS